MKRIRLSLLTLIVALQSLLLASCASKTTSLAVATAAGRDVVNDAYALRMAGKADEARSMLESNAAGRGVTCQRDLHRT